MRSASWKLFKAMIRNIGSEALNREMIGFTLEAPVEPVRYEDIIAYANAAKDASSYLGDHAPVPQAPTRRALDRFKHARPGRHHLYARHPQTLSPDAGGRLTNFWKGKVVH